MIAVTISQLYKLSTAPPSPGRLSAQQLGKPLSCSLLVSAIVVDVVGAARYVRQQKALVNGKIHSGGFDLLLVWALLSLVGSYRHFIPQSHSSISSTNLCRLF